MGGWGGGTNPSRNYNSKFFIPVKGADSLTQGFHYRNFVGGGGQKETQNNKKIYQVLGLFGIVHNCTVIMGTEPAAE